MGKRAMFNSDCGEPSRPAKKPRLTESESTTNVANPTSTKTSNNANLGNLFHLKLLMLFLIRGIGAGCQFKLGCEMPDLGGKFDDIIFKYEVKNANGCQEWRRVCLQAKHKQDDNKKIKADDLLAEKGDFCLVKYFRSYCRGLLPRVNYSDEDVIDNLTICTNVGFDESEFKSRGIKLKPFVPSGENPIFKKILSFKSQSSEDQKIYFQLENTLGLKENLKKDSDIDLLAAVLIKRISTSKGGTIWLNPKSHELFQMYHWALVSEKVIDMKTGKFHQDFVSGKNISKNAAELRHTIDKLAFINKLKWKSADFAFDTQFGINLTGEIEKLPQLITENEINQFLEKLVFVINTPNEAKLDPILKGELGKNYKLLDTDLQSYSFFQKMSKWFTYTKNDTQWLTPQDGRSILQNIEKEVDSIRVYAISDEYKQNIINTAFTFNDDAIKVMADQLKMSLLDRSEVKVVQITTDWLAGTAVKVISALKTLKDYECDDSYVMVSLLNWKTKEQKKRIRDTLCKKELPNNLLVVICDDETQIQVVSNQNIFSDDNNGPNPMKVIVTHKSFDENIDSSEMIKDEIVFGQMSKVSQKDLLSKAVMFQETLLKDGEEQKQQPTVEEIIGISNKHNEVIDLDPVIDLPSIEMILNRKLVMPSFNSSFSSDLSLYFERRIKPSNVNRDKLLEKLTKALENKYKETDTKRELKLRNELKLSNSLEIEWSPHLMEERKSEIWTKIKKLLPECLNDSQTEKSASITEDELADGNWNKSKVVILSSLPGSGKSTILSSLYRKIKKLNPLYLVVKINFTDYVEALSKWEVTSDVISFFVHHLPAINNNPLAQSLISHRLQTSGGIVLMIDGFDEIDGKHQDKAIQFMKAILQTKLDRLYVTTRPHLNDKLQNGFFQFNYIYTLENFSEKDQINYLCKCWDHSNELSKTIRFFAESLVKKVAENLKDKEKTFVGIPLQCKILAECFAQRIEKVLHNGADSKQQLEDLIKDNKFDLLSLYKQLMDTKEKIFRQKQATKLGNISTDNVFAKLLLRLMEMYHTKLALRTIVSDSSVLDYLWPPSPSLESEDDKETTKQNLEEGSLIFGLTFNKSNEENQLEFIHRTFAEYLVAKYLYEGLLLDDKKANKLLHNNTQFFVESILVLDEYDGVRTFLDSMLRDIVESKDWRDMVGIQQKLLPLQYLNLAFSFNLEKHCKLLTTAFEGKYSNIFGLIADCLDATQDPSVFRSTMKKLFKDVYPSCADQNRKVIERFLHSYESDEPDQDHMERVVKSLPPHRAYTTRNSYDLYWDKSIPFSYWNQKQTKDNVELALNFLLENSKCIKYIKYVYGIGREWSDTLYFFVCNEFYDSLIDEYVQFLSETFDDDSLTNIFIGAFKIGLLYKNNDETNSPGNLFDKRIPQFFTMLQKIEKPQVLRRISRKVLIVAPVTFEKYYIIPFDEVAPSDNLLSPNSLELTRLHIAAFKKGSANIIQQFNQIKRKKEMVSILMDKEFSPLYMAAASGNNDAFRVMLSFLKEELTAQKLLQDFTCNRPDGFLFGALLDAIKYKRIDMFQLILCGVKESLGQNGLLALLGPLNREKTDVVGQDGVVALLGPRDLNHGNIDDVDEMGSNDSAKRLEISEVLIEACKKKEFMKTIAETLDDGYEKLNELLFKIDYEESDIFYDLSDGMVSHFGEENVLGMIQAEGSFSSWLKLIFDNTRWKADVGDFMDESSLDFLRKNGLVSEFVQCIISSREADGEEKQVKMSYWAEWFSSDYFEDEDNDYVLAVLKSFLKCVSEDENGQERLKELVSHDQYELIFDILRINRCGNFQIMLRYLSDENRKEVCEKIFNYLLTTQTLPMIYWKYASNVIWFLSEYYFESQTWDDICQILLSNRHFKDRWNRDGGIRSIWSLSVQLIDYYELDILDGFLEWATERLGKDESTTSQKIKELILHDDGSGVVLFEAAQEKGHIIINIMLNIMLKYLNEEDRNEIEQRLTAYQRIRIQRR